MRFLGIGECNDLAAMYHGLRERGHEVRVYVEDPAFRDVHGGMLDFADDWVGQLPWLKEAGREGIAIFESAQKGALQDELRSQGFNVIGGSALGDRLEADREYGQSMLREAGLKTARSLRFDSFTAAADFLSKEPGRYVLKFNGANVVRTRNYVGELDDASDMLALLSIYAARSPGGAAVDFVLMEHVEGVEVGVGAYFNGEDFLETACIDFEHKHFFPGELGELTGEMGTIVSYRNSARLFDAALAPLAPVLRDGGYLGYINVNLIVNAHGLWPLEFTSRFGYPGFAICEALHEEPWEDIFTGMLRKNKTRIATKPGFSAGVVLTVPPFPYTQGYDDISKGMPVGFRPGFTAADRASLYLSEVALSGGQLVTSGATGYVGVATGTGASVHEAADAAGALAAKVVVPNLRYRRDIGERVMAADWKLLAGYGLVDVPGHA